MWHSYRAKNYILPCDHISPHIFNFLFSLFFIETKFFLLCQWKFEYRTDIQTIRRMVRLCTALLHTVHKNVVNMVPLAKYVLCSRRINRLTWIHSSRSIFSSLLQFWNLSPICVIKSHSFKILILSPICVIKSHSFKLLNLFPICVVKSHSF